MSIRPSRRYLTDVSLPYQERPRFGGAFLFLNCVGRLPVWGIRCAVPECHGFSHNAIAAGDRSFRVPIGSKPAFACEQSGSVIGVCNAQARPFSNAGPARTSAVLQTSSTP